MKRTVIVLLMLCFVLVTSHLSADGKAPPPPKDPSDQLQPLSKSLQVDIFLDGSGSMRGFVTPGDFTIYAKALHVLQDTAITGSSDGQPTFTKFGTGLTSLREQGFTKAALPTFYDEQETLIDKVFEAASDKNLTVIVTDLFQNEADTALLIEKVRDKYLHVGLAVGIVGIRSEFSGQVYDIGIEGRNFGYNGLRPFYMILLGKHADIANFYELLQHNGLNKFSDTHFIIFSPYLVDQVPSFADAQFESMKKMVEVTNLVADGVQDNRLRQFRLKAETGSFRVALEPEALPYTLGYDGSLMDTSISIKKFNRGKLVSLGPDSNLIDVGGFATEKPKTGKPKIVFDTEFHGLPDPGVYLFEITLFPKLNAYNNSPWFDAWDMKTEQIAEWQKDPKTFKGDTTLNLERLLTGLWQANWELHRPKVAHIFCYVEK